MAKRYRVTVEAMQVPTFKDLDGLEQYKDDFIRVAEWCGGSEKWSRLRPIAIDIETAETSLDAIAEEGDWVVKIAGDFDVWSDAFFQANAEPVEESGT